MADEQPKEQPGSGGFEIPKMEMPEMPKMELPSWMGGKPADGAEGDGAAPQFPNLEMPKMEMPSWMPGQAAEGAEGEAGENKGFELPKMEMPPMPEMPAQLTETFGCCGDSSRTKVEE